MKNKILKYLLVCLVVMFSLFLSSCNKTKETSTRITIDINPSIEFIVDENNKVVSVTALNDDGSILVVGELFIGLDIEEATNKVVELATQMGYLIEGHMEKQENLIKISVSGAKKHADKIYKELEKEMNNCLEKLDIEAQIQKVEALNKEALIALTKEVSTYSEEDLSAMSEEELYDVLKLSRIETALLVTEDMREAYYRAKEYEISFVEKESTAEVIEAMGGVYNLIYMGYQTALDIYSKAIQNLDEFRYEQFVSPDSEYQKTLIELRNAKTEFLKQRSYTFKLDINGEEYASAIINLQAKENTYNQLLFAYEILGKNINESLEKIIEVLKNSEASLKELEDKFSDDIKTKLKDNAALLETKLNETKDNFFNNFENAHKDDIKKIEDNLKQQKQELIDSLNQE